MISAKHQRPDEEHRLMRQYLAAVTVAIAGWIALAVIIRLLPSSVTAPSSDPPLALLVIMMLAFAATVEASTTVRRALKARAALRRARSVAAIQAKRLRRMALISGAVCLAAAAAAAVASWLVPPRILPVTGSLYVAFVIAGPGLLIAAHGLNRGWIADDPSTAIAPTPQERDAVAKLLEGQKEQIQRNEVTLQEQREKIAAIYLTIREFEPPSESRVSSNAIWAIVGFVLGIVGNWIAQPLFDVLIAPLRTS